MSQPATPQIFKKISDIMKQIGAIGKDRKNQQQGFNFRGIDDVYNELHPRLAEHGVFSTTEVMEERREDRTSAKGSALIYVILKIKYTFFAEDGSFVHVVVIGEGMDSGDKASNKAMAIAHKYALLQLFAIPTQEAKDPDGESHDLKPKGGQPNGAKQSDEPKEQNFEKSEREKRVLTMMESFRKIGVSEARIREKYNLKTAQPMFELTDAQLEELSQIGPQIHKKQKPATEFFPLKNHAPKGA